MLRLTLEVLPGGSERRKRTIGRLDVANVGGDLREGYYEVERYVGNRRDPHRTARLGPHRRRQSAWVLALKAIQAIC